MITKDNFIETTMKRLKKLEEGQCVIIKTYKKDRSLTIERLKDEQVNVYEEGFENKVYKDIKENELKKLLKMLGRIEFPRSYSLWLQVTNQKEN
ncbi:hypothetical protein [Niameybacter massiliensis]|uniref:hypothetical protein n=1 Tax=Niameybacter massiliensis TaxID=1658108 RepID=UPI0006B41EC9|nr:hypothetical protein [Niameybacter massiliensis]